MSECVGICNSCTGSCINQTSVAAVGHVTEYNNINQLVGIYPIDSSGTILNYKYGGSITGYDMVNPYMMGMFSYGTATLIAKTSSLSTATISNYSVIESYYTTQGRICNADTFINYRARVNEIATNWTNNSSWNEASGYYVALMLKYYPNSAVGRIRSEYSSWPEYNIDIDQSGYNGGYRAIRGNDSASGSELVSSGNYYMAAVRYFTATETNIGRFGYYNPYASLNGVRHDFANCGDYVNKFPDALVNHRYMYTETTSPQYTQARLNVAGSWKTPQSVKIKVGGTWKSLEP